VTAQGSAHIERSGTTTSLTCAARRGGWGARCGVEQRAARTKPGSQYAASCRGTRRGRVRRRGGPDAFRLRV